MKENGFRNQIQRKGKHNKPLSECPQQRNKGIAKTRANFAMTMMAACYNLKRLVHFQVAGIKAF